MVLPGELVLETSDGAADLVTGAELASMLAVAPGRVRLVTVSACWSAALAPMGQLEFLRFAAPEGPPVEDGAEPEQRQAGLQALAVELVDRLDCAVLAMRYPVTDDFSIALAERLYRALVADGQSLPARSARPFVNWPELSRRWRRPLRRCSGRVRSTSGWPRRRRTRARIRAGNKTRPSWPGSRRRQITLSAGR